MVTEIPPVTSSQQLSEKIEEKIPSTESKKSKESRPGATVLGLWQLAGTQQAEEIRISRIKTEKSRRE